MSMTVNPKVGDAITYRLRPSENPCNPLRLWHGLVEYVYDGRGNPNWYRVQLTDEGYEGIRELVIGFQIVEVVVVYEVKEERGDKLSSIHFGEMRGC